MSEPARILAIMGSGETAPTMVKMHRSLIDRVADSDAGGAGGGAILLDTAYGFQENADIVSARAVEYFRESVGRTVDIVTWRTAGDDPSKRERALDQVRRASYVFCGPGSPTYALSVWRGTPLPDLLADKLARGGCVTFASAAALTLGVVTVPVYEIYKVGHEPHWEEGLDLLSALGLRVAVIPHYDNAEGGNHDTRFCYLGERRLARLERELGDGAFVLGVDEHTACIIDVGEATVTVAGNGGVTVRRQGESTVFPAGSELTIDDLVHGHGHAGHLAKAAAPVVAPAEAPAPAGVLAEAEKLAAEFDVAVERRDIDAAVAAVLALDDAIVAWSRDTLQSDEADRARSLFRGMIVRLGELARVGARDPRQVVSPFVDAVLDARARARAGGDYNTADALRDRLVAAGVEVHDEPRGTTWELVDTDGRPDGTPESGC